MYTLDPKLVHTIFGGALITGYAPDSFVKIEYNKDRYELTVGADGLGARAKSNDESARVTIRLMPNAIGNLPLRAAQALDKATNAGALPLVITDLSTGKIFAAEGAWVMKDPGQDFQTTIQPIEWVLETDSLVSS